MQIPNSSFSSSLLDLESVYDSHTKQESSPTLGSDLNSILPSTEENKVLPLHIRIFNRAQTTQKESKKDLLRIIEELIDKLEIHQQKLGNQINEIGTQAIRDYTPEKISENDNLKIQVLSYLADPHRIFKEIQKEYNDENDKILSSTTLTGLLKKKIESYGLSNTNGDTLKLDHHQPTIYGRIPQINDKNEINDLNKEIEADSPWTAPIGFMKHQGSIYCFVGKEELQKAVIDKIIDSLLDKSSICRPTTIWNQIEKEIESFLVNPIEQQKRKKEVLDNFVTTYIESFIGPFIRELSPRNSFEINRKGLMTNLEEEMGSENLRPNFEIIQESMLKLYIKNQKSRLLKLVRCQLVYIQMQHELKKYSESLTPEEKNRRLISAKKYYVDSLKNKIERLITIDFPELIDKEETAKNFEMIFETR